MRVHCPVRLYLALVDCVDSASDLAEHFRSTPAGSGELCKCPTFTALSQLHLTGFLPACQNNRYVSKKEYTFSVLPTWKFYSWAQTRLRRSARQVLWPPVFVPPVRIFDAPPAKRCCNLLECHVLTSSVAQSSTFARSKSWLLCY